MKTLFETAKEFTLGGKQIKMKYVAKVLPSGCNKEQLVFNFDAYTLSAVYILDEDGIDMSYTTTREGNHTWEVALYVNEEVAENNAVMMQFGASEYESIIPDMTYEGIESLLERLVSTLD